MQNKFYLFLKRSLIFIVLLTFVIVSARAVIAAQTLSQRLNGRILLQVQQKGEAWYVKDGKRYYMKDGATAFQMLRSFGLGIKNSDLAKINTEGGVNKVDKKLVERMKGKILLQVESKGEAWYVNPTTGLRYYMKDGEEAYKLMRKFGLGITDKDLTTIPIGELVVEEKTLVESITETGNSVDTLLKNFYDKIGVTPKAKEMCESESGKMLEWKEEDCIRAVAGEIWIGMDYFMLTYIYGYPDHKNVMNYGYGDQRQYCWDDLDLKMSCFYDHDGDYKIDAYN